MSGWPWMKGKLTAIAHVNTNEETTLQDDESTDKRPILKDLIYKYRDLIDVMEVELSHLDKYDPQKHDDLWCLRFLLSHKLDPVPAIAAANTTLHFRRKHKLDKLDIRGFPPQDYNKFKPNFFPSFQRFMRYVTGSTNNNGKIKKTSKEEGDVDEQQKKQQPICYVVPDHQTLGVLTYIDLGNIDTHLSAELSLEDWIAGLAYLNEYNYQWLDYLSRTTGRLTKSIRLVDVSSAQLNQVDRICQQKYTEAVATMEDCFPQAVSSIYICYAPFWIQSPWRVIKPFLPVRVVAKMDFLNPKDNEDDKSKLLQQVPPQHLSIKFGGTNQDTAQQQQRKSWTEVTTSPQKRALAKKIESLGNMPSAKGLPSI